MAVITSPKKGSPAQYVKKPSPVIGAADVKAAPKPLPMQLAAPKKVTAKKPVMQVDTQNVNNLDKTVISSDSKTIEGGPVLMVEEPHAVVGVTMSMTRSLQNYESFKFQVHVSVPCSNTDESKSAAYDWAKDWVEERVNMLNHEVNQLLS